LFVPTFELEAAGILAALMFLCASAYAGMRLERWRRDRKTQKWLRELQREKPGDHRWDRRP